MGEQRAHKHTGYRQSDTQQWRGARTSTSEFHPDILFTAQRQLPVLCPVFDVSTADISNHSGGGVCSEEHIFLLSNLGLEPVTGG
jgi:hypothetical protein